MPRMSQSVIRYSVGNEHNPADPWGRSELVIHADGTARLDHHFSRKPDIGVWTGEIDAVALSSLWAALDQAGFPAVPATSAIAPDSTVRKLAVETDGVARVAFVSWHGSPLPGYAEAFDLIDAMISKLSDGAVRYPGAVTSIGKLESSDRTVWEALFRGYIDFYERTEPDEMYEQAWREFQADTRVHALGARLGNRLVGITHFFIHPSTSGPDVCYLQDLFTAPDSRGQGVARALITAVTEWAVGQGCGRVYWHTQARNTTARYLYDKVAENRGFIQYVIPL